MRVHDLGVLVGEITVFGGPYSNYQALHALLELSEASAATAQQVARTLICTGDLVAYCGAPVQTVQAARAAKVHVVAGNVEKQLAENAPHCGCGFEAGTTCDLLSAGWYAFANAQITAELRAWMAQLPDMICFTHAGKRYAVVHGGMQDVARFIWSVSNEDIFSEEINNIKAVCPDVDVVLAGHSGIAFERRAGDVHWVNAGVIGMPPHDGTPCTEYLHIASNGTHRLRRLSYDVDGARADMQDAGLVQGYHTSLATGIWPSEDVLPQELRR